MLDKCLLQRVQAPVRYKALDGDDVGAVCLRCQRQTRQDPTTIDEYRACSAGALVTADFCPSQSFALSQKVQKRDPQSSGTGIGLPLTEIAMPVLHFARPSYTANG